MSVFDQTSPAKGIARAKRATIEIAPGVHVPKVALTNYLGDLIGAQTPISADGDSVYTKDIKSALSDPGTFINADLNTLFNNLDDSIVDSSSENPKWFEFFLERPIRAEAVAVVASTGDFSNVKVFFKDRQGTILATGDDSANNTKYTARRYPLPLATNVCCIRVEFHTSDPVTVSFIYIRKQNDVVALIAGVRDDGTSGQVMLDNENRLEVNSQPYLYSIAEGAIGGHTGLLKFGARTSVIANTQSLIWQGTNALYTDLTSAEQLKIVSSSAEDSALGTGVRTFFISGLDANWMEQSETVTLSGITPAATVNSYIRINRGRGATSGTAATNVGTIQITNNAGTVQLAQIFPGDNSTMIVRWTVPAGKVAYITKGTVSTDSNKGLRISLFTRLNDGGILYPWVVQYRAYVFSGAALFPFDIPFAIPAKTDIEVRVLTPVAAGTTSCGATFELWYEDV